MTQPSRRRPGQAVRPLLTVCVPTYRRPDLLARALASITAASAGAPDDAVEVLISDNAPDVGEQVAMQWLASWRGPTRYLANQQDLGAIANFNQCIREAAGRFVMLVHDDDYLLPDALPQVLSVVANAGTARCFLFGVLVVDGDGNVLRRQGGRITERLSPQIALRRVLTNSSLVRIPALVVDRDAVLAVGGFDDTVGNPTDFDLFVRLFARYGLTAVAQTISGYTVHEAAQTSSMFRPDMIDIVMTIFDRAVATKILPESAVRECQVEWFHQFVLGGAYRHLRAGDTNEARRILRLLDLPAMRQLGSSHRWGPVRLIFAILVRLPPGFSHRLSRIIRRIGLEHRIWMAL